MGCGCTAFIGFTRRRKPTRGDETRPGKGKVARSVNSVPAILSKNIQAVAARSNLCKSIHLYSGCSLYRFAVLHCPSPHASRSSRCHPTRLLAGGTVVSTHLRSTILRARISGCFIFARYLVFHEFPSKRSEQPNEPGVSQRGTSRA